MFFTIVIINEIIESFSSHRQLFWFVFGPWFNYDFRFRILTMILWTWVTWVLLIPSWIIAISFLKGSIWNINQFRQKHALLHCGIALSSCISLCFRFYTWTIWTLNIHYAVYRSQACTEHWCALVTLGWSSNVFCHRWVMTVWLFVCHRPRWSMRLPCSDGKLHHRCGKALWQNKFSILSAGPSSLEQFG